jgi:ATP-dependent Clp protease ATP-binding subunit ClpA
MIKIVGKFVIELRDQIKEKNVKLKVTDEAIDWLIEKGFDAKMGARPLQRIIDKEIKRPLARMMLFGDLKEGGTLVITEKNGELILNSKPKLARMLAIEA